jgi:hypothetical protein
MGVSFPFVILLGTAGISLLLCVLLGFQESNRVALYWMNPTRMSSLNENTDLVQRSRHEAEKRIVEEYIASLKFLSLRERQLSLQVLPHSSHGCWVTSQPRQHSADFKAFKEI